MADNTFNLPDDTEFVAGEPVKGSHPQQIKDSIIANMGMTYGINGALTDFTGIGVQHGTGMTISSNVSCKMLTTVLIKGDFVLQSGNTITVPAFDPTATLPRFLGDNQKLITEFYTAMNSSGTYLAGQEGSGGAGYGNGGTADNTAGVGYGGSNNWQYMTHLIGGYTVQDDGSTIEALGGGSLRILVEGNVTIAGTINANGENGTLAPGNDETGGGGGGSIVIICTGTYTGAGGALNAKGGNGYSGFDTGGGGGGYIGIVTSEVVSASSNSAAAGAGGNSPTGDGAAGLVETVTSFTSSEIRAWMRGAALVV